MREYFLTPIEEDIPAPRHTQIKPRCFTCKKFPVCNLREDYLKTAYLIQEVIGDPQDDFALNWDCNCSPILSGIKFDNPETYFPSTVELIDQGEGTFMDAAYKDLDTICVRYRSEEGYFIDFLVTWKDNSYSVAPGVEAYYKLDFEMSISSISEIVTGAEIWREEMTRENEERDVINTTHFYAKLECRFYEWEKGLTEEEGIKRLIAEFPNGVPLKDGKYYHLATFHIENGKIPCFKPCQDKVAFAPMPYPVYVPPHVCKTEPVKRGDMSNGNV